MSKSILITGATSGIGLALANRVAMGNQLFVTGSRPFATLSTKPPGAYIEADQSDPLNAATSVKSTLDAAGISSLDLVILNAGTGFWRAPATESETELSATLTINLAGTIAIAHVLAPLILAKKGTLVLVGSTARKGSANLASYAATKAGLDGFARALNSEWQGRASVRAIHPGPTRTAMHDKAGLDVTKSAFLFARPDETAGMILAAAKRNGWRHDLTFASRMVYAITSRVSP